MTGIDKIGEIYKGNINPKEKDTQKGKGDINDLEDPGAGRP